MLTILLPANFTPSQTPHPTPLTSAPIIPVLSSPYSAPPVYTCFPNSPAKYPLARYPAFERLLRFKCSKRNSPSLLRLLILFKHNFNQRGKLFLLITSLNCFFQHKTYIFMKGMVYPTVFHGGRNTCRCRCAYG